MVVSDVRGDDPAGLRSRRVSVLVASKGARRGGGALCASRGPGAARPGDEVAVRLDDYDKEAWVLGRVVRYRSDEDLSAAVHKSHFGALPCTPSTRRLLDGVAVRFFDRSTWPAGPRRRREMTL